MAADPYYKDVVLLLNCNGEEGSAFFSDSSLIRNSVSANGGAQIRTAQFKFGGSSAYFNGTGALLSVPAHSALDFGTLDFTIEFFMRSTQSTGSWPGVITVDRPTVVSGVWTITNRTNFSSGANQINLASHFGSWTDFAINTSYNPNDGVWHHIAFTRQGTTIRGFFDGILAGSWTIASNRAFGVAGRGLLIGYNNSDYVYYSGYLDGIRLTRGVARYVSSFTPPTEEFEDEFAAYFTTSVSTYIANRLSLTTPVRDTKQSITNDQYAGNFRVRGTTKMKVGLARPVRQAIVVLMDEVTGLAVRRQISDPVTGAYAFNNIRNDIRYTVVAYDLNGEFNAVVADNLTAEPMT